MLDTFTGFASGLFHLPGSARGQLNFVFAALGGLEAQVAQLRQERG